MNIPKAVHEPNTPHAPRDWCCTTCYRRFLTRVMAETCDHTGAFYADQPVGEPPAGLQQDAPPAKQAETWRDRPAML